MSQPAFKRILLKLSGEALMGDDAYGINRDVVAGIVRDVAEVAQLGVEVGIVIGGGNIFRGMAGEGSGMDRPTADYMGMLATVMNAMALADAFRVAGVDARVQSGLRIDQVVEPYVRANSLRYLAEGKIVIFGAGTGNPFFTTDTAAALRAAEMECNILLKGTQVDGVYSADPKRDPSAVRYDELTYLNVLANQLNVMDAAAISLARENNLPIIVFNIGEEGSFGRVMRGEGPFTRIVETAE